MHRACLTLWGLANMSASHNSPGEHISSFCLNSDFATWTTYASPKSKQSSSVAIVITRKVGAALHTRDAKYRTKVDRDCTKEIKRRKLQACTQTSHQRQHATARKYKDHRRVNTNKHEHRLCGQTTDDAQQTSRPLKPTLSAMG